MFQSNGEKSSLQIKKVRAGTISQNQIEENM